MNKRIKYFVEMLENAEFTDDQRRAIEEAVATSKEYSDGFDTDDLNNALSKLQIIWALLPDLLESIKGE